MCSSIRLTETLQGKSVLINRFLMKSILSTFAFLCTALLSFAQNDRWQQRVKYEMNIDFDVTNHRYRGTQKLTYSNNSPDTLTKVFYHLYLNAFQPGSQMDVRARLISDPDPRVKDRISKLSPDEIGYEKIKSLKQNGKDSAGSEPGATYPAGNQTCFRYGI
jgi:hypothetical protein